jgi:hypothetical protein
MGRLPALFVVLFVVLLALCVHFLPVLTAAFLLALSNTEKLLWHKILGELIDAALYQGIKIHGKQILL